MRLWLKGKGPLSFLFASTSREQYLVRYVLREHARGRVLADILDDAYLRNRTTPSDRARLLERPEVVAALGANSVSELRLAVDSLDRAARSRQPSSVAARQGDPGTAAS